MNNQSGVDERVRVAHGTGRMHDQEASFVVACDADGGRAIWIATTTDGRAETALVEPAGATATNWSIGARHALELEDLERQVAIVHAITAGPAGRSVAIASVAGTHRVTLGPERRFADRLTLPATASLHLDGQLEWEFTIEQARMVDWSSLRTTAAAAGKPATVAWSASSETTIETRLVPASGHLLVRLRMNGTEGWFILDTGATECVVLPAFADRAGLRPAGSRLLTSIAGVERAAQVDLGDITIGALTISGTAGVVSEALASLPQTLGTDFDGIIGAHVFSHGVVSMDLRDGSAAIAPTAPAGVAWTAVQFQNLHPLIEGTYEGRRALFRLDTGAVPGLLFSATAVRTQSLLDGRETIAVPTEGALELRYGKLRSFEIAGVTLRDVDALFSTGSATVLSDRVTAGLVGIPILRGFKVTVDLPGRRIALIQRT